VENIVYLTIIHLTSSLVVWMRRVHSHSCYLHIARWRWVRCRGQHILSVITWRPATFVGWRWQGVGVIWKEKHNAKFIYRYYYYKQLVGADKPQHTKYLDVNRFLEKVWKYPDCKWCYWYLQQPRAQPETGERTRGVPLARKM
jgi:hypothetical protein